MGPKMNWNSIPNQSHSLGPTTLSCKPRLLHCTQESSEIGKYQSFLVAFLPSAYSIFGYWKNVGPQGRSAHPLLWFPSLSPTAQIHLKVARTPVHILPECISSYTAALTQGAPLWLSPTFACVNRTGNAKSLWFFNCRQVIIEWSRISQYLPWVSFCSRSTAACRILPDPWIFLAAV